MKAHGFRGGHGAVALAISLTAGCAGAPALEQRAAVDADLTFEARAVIAASDLDMAATGYADRQLRQTAGARDRLTVLRLDGGGAPSAAEAIVSNSVVGWPGPIGLSPDGRFALVVETQGELEDSLVEVEDPYNASPGAQVTAVDLSDLSQPRVSGAIEVCRDPSAVDVHPSGRFAFIGCRDATRPLMIVSLEDGAPVAAFAVSATLPEGLGSEETPGVTFSRLSPDGAHAALNIANRAIVFVCLQADLAGATASAVVIGAPARFKQGAFAMGRWSLDGRFYITTDTGWGPGPLDAATNGPGRIVSLAFDERAGARVVSEVEVSLSPEGFDIDPEGRLLAVLNMERTYLPDRLPFSAFGRRDQSSISLIAFDPSSGALRAVDGPVAFDAILPEDVVFDNAGATIAAVTYQDSKTDPQAAWAQLFQIDRSGAAPRLVPTSTRWPLPRGAHDLAVVR